MGGQTYSGAFAATIVSWSVQRARYKYKHLYHTCKIVIVHRVVNDSRGSFKETNVDRGAFGSLYDWNPEANARRRSLQRFYTDC